MRVRVCCPAKVNLHLEVHGRRPDGYHELRTLMATVGLWDTLEIRPASPGVLDLTIEPVEALPPEGENLVVRAARLLLRRFALKAGASINLHKSIPVGAGLGGGSSDAAGALVALSRFWGLPAGIDELAPLAATLGSDVPFFLHGGACWAVGRGVDLIPAPDLPSWWLVLDPGSEMMATTQVYDRLGSAPLGEVPPKRPLASWLDAAGDEWLSRCCNDLYTAAVAVSPDVAKRLDALRATAPLLAQLSGSGGTVFGVFPDEGSARRARVRLSGEELTVVPLLGRAASRPWPALLEE